MRDREADPMGEQTWSITPRSEVYSADGEKLGSVTAVHPTYLTVAKGVFFPTERYVPASAIAQVDARTVRLSLTRDQIEQQPWDTLPTDQEREAPGDHPARPREQTAEEHRDEQASQPAEHTGETLADTDDETLALREERMVPHTEERRVGEIGVRVTSEEHTGRLEVDATHEEVEVEHVPVGKVVTERVAPWHEDDVLVVPVYEEQLAVVKRLVMREQVRIRRVGVTERRLIEEPLRRERVVIDDRDQTGRVQEHYAQVDDVTQSDTGSTPQP